MLLDWEMPYSCPAENKRRLEALARAFDPTERALITNLTSQEHDPVARLPLEILLRIIDFLHPLCAWSYRVVSRRWNCVLAADAVVGAQLLGLEARDPSTSRTNSGLVPTRTL